MRLHYKNYRRRAWMNNSKCCKFVFSYLHLFEKKNKNGSIYVYISCAQREYVSDRIYKRNLSFFYKNDHKNDCIHQL